MSRGIRCLAFATSLIFLASALGKASADEMGFIDGAQIIFIAGLAILTASLFQTRAMQLALATIFSAFATYLVYFHILLESLDCGCFGDDWRVPAWLVLSLDITLAFAWLCVFFKNRVETRFLIRLSLVACAVCTLSFSLNGAIEWLRSRNEMSEHLASSTQDQLRLINESSAIYFLTTRCSTCVENLSEFESYCQLNGINALVAIGNDALESPDVELPVIVFPVSETEFRSLPAAHRIRDGRFDAELVFKSP
ncbi:MAG: hypothetical protein ACF788_02345 [Novipirellula sp. JB048]